MDAWDHEIDRAEVQPQQPLGFSRRREGIWLYTPHSLRASANWGFVRPSPQQEGVADRGRRVVPWACLWVVADGVHNEAQEGHIG